MWPGKSGGMESVELDKCFVYKPGCVQPDEEEGASGEQVVEQLQAISFEPQPRPILWPGVPITAAAAQAAPDSIHGRRHALPSWASCGNLWRRNLRRDADVAPLKRARWRSQRPADRDQYRARRLREAQQYVVPQPEHAGLAASRFGICPCSSRCDVRVCQIERRCQLVSRGLLGGKCPDGKCRVCRRSAALECEAPRPQHHLRSLFFFCAPVGTALGRSTTIETACIAAFLHCPASVRVASFYLLLCPSPSPSPRPAFPHHADSASAGTGISIATT